MSVQNYKNHVRYYPPHHFVFYPVLLILISFSVYKALNDESLAAMWWMFSILFFLLGWLSFMMRQHYALTLQNRLVRMEMRHKYFVLSGKDFEPLESQLSFGQIAALRFSSDDELLSLIEKTITENLTPQQIKKEISGWKADGMRV